jgi:ParB family transcriptional regulator, chromosome partitioning protein
MSPTPTTTKKRRPVSAETRPDPLATVQTVVSIPLDKLHRHPKNRVITAESVFDLMESLQEHGQRDPLRVRPLADPIGHYEILSGERRFVAASMVPGFESLLCIVETHSEEQSLIELAVANAARKDLDPIERGELLRELIESGMDRAAAGRLFGLNFGALQLPEVQNVSARRNLRG